MLELLLQAAPPVDFVAEHGSFVAWAVGGLITLWVATFLWTWGVIWAGFREEKQRLADLKVEVDEVKERVTRYEGHVGAGDRTLNEINEHIKREETVTWRKIDEIASAVARMQVENVEAHGKIIEGRAAILERVKAVETKVETLEAGSRATNGDLGRMVRALEGMTQELKTAGKAGRRS